MKILIVDDDPLSQLTLRATLAPFGECVCAGNGREGVDLFTLALNDGKPFGVVFMDIQMPVMDGHAALAAIRELERARAVAPGQEAKVVMITCHDDVKNVATSFFRGNATCYFTKPLHLAAMLETLKKESVL
ncbi:response regulator [Solidesulfovibrio carbinolicus]|uniref:Response regulator n=1 Tax=Solidesulfovibrio carbinolicus TaxID=296842 RepID=A0A4P6HHC0_9BACT|nr:response regulator [Solidesulfovibrio carbinolicus]QAZ66387.1 response regulator [Solidesulfovibrio carbinolicus]